MSDRSRTRTAASRGEDDRWSVDSAETADSDEKANSDEKADSGKAADEWHSSDRSQRCRRGSVPVVSAVLLVGTAVLLAATVAGAGFALEDAASTEPAPTATFSSSASNDRLAVVHEGGEPLDTETLTLRISVDGEPLAHQPDVPFFSQRGFRPGPTGPFNTASDSTWTVGERASLRVAQSNQPTLEPGATVEIRVVAEETEIARLTTTVEDS